MLLKKITLPLILSVLAIIYYVSFNFVYTSASTDLITLQVENSKNQANLISNLLSQKIKSGSSKEIVKIELQNSIENMSTQYSFVCMFDTAGREICHPNIKKIGTVLSESNSVIKSMSNFTLETNFKQAILERKAIGGIREMENYTEIVYLSPVKNTDWIIASHSNILKFRTVFDALKEKLTLLFILIWLSSSLIIYFFLQYINSKNLQKISDLNSATGTLYFNKLNKINEAISRNTSSNTATEKTIRLLCNKGTKLTPVLIENIAFIYTQNKITYIVEHSKQTSTINLTLDELFKVLNNTIFYRASRQVILSIKAIDKIEKYGNTQLKILTKLILPIEIIISKAKLTDFKKWAGKS